MTKKKYLMLFLEKVKELWEPARGFLVLLRYEVLQEAQIDELFHLFKGVVANMYNDQRKRKLQRAIDLIAKTKEQAQKGENTDLESGLDQLLAEV